jgi:dTDP-4-dehydrorhamnose 3,5-epimerase-like enzyme
MFDKRGTLSFIEEREHIPFSIKRVFYFYNIEKHQYRGAHAHYQMEELLIAITGRFRVSLYDGKVKYDIELNSPSQGLYIPPLAWRKVYDFSEGSIGLALVSTYYDEDDYIRDYEEFLQVVKSQ